MNRLMQKWAQMWRIREKPNQPFGLHCAGFMRQWTSKGHWIGQCQVDLDSFSKAGSMYSQETWKDARQCFPTGCLVFAGNMDHQTVISKAYRLNEFAILDSQGTGWDDTQRDFLTLHSAQAPQASVCYHHLYIGSSLHCQSHCVNPRLLSHHQAQACRVTSRTSTARRHWFQVPLMTSSTFGRQDNTDAEFWLCQSDCDSNVNLLRFALPLDCYSVMMEWDSYTLQAFGPMVNGMAGIGCGLP